MTGYMADASWQARDVNCYGDSPDGRAGMRCVGKIILTVEPRVKCGTASNAFFALREARGDGRRGNIIKGGS